MQGTKRDKTQMPQDGAKTDTASLSLRYRRRLIRKRLLWRAFRKRRDLTLVSDRRAQVRPNGILCFTTLRNESMRLPYFLEHYRALGVDHFFMVDNNSDDGCATYLTEQPDVTLYQTGESYRASRFGVDWLNWLQRRHAHGHWAVVADVDELLVYPKHDTQDLKSLTQWLSAKGHRMLGAVMLDMFPKGSPDGQRYSAGQNPIDVLSWFDAHGYWAQRQPKLDNLWLQGGPRARCFFGDDPDKAPTLNKIPLVHWDRRFAFVNSCHSALPSHLNHTWTVPVSGALLHTKFLPGTAERARIEQARDEHFHVSTRYVDYYETLQSSPNLWDASATKYDGWQQLVDLKLMFQGDW